MTVVAGSWQTQSMHFAGTPINEGGSFGYILSGDYKAQIMKIEGWHKKDAPGNDVTSVLFHGKVIEATDPTALTEIGKEASLFLSVDPGEKGGGSGKWKGLLVSVGFGEETLPADMVMNSEWCNTNLLGKIVHINVQSPPYQEGVKVKLEDVNINILRPTTYLERKALAAGQPAQAMRAPVQMQQPVQQPAFVQPQMPVAQPQMAVAGAGFPPAPQVMQPAPQVVQPANGSTPFNPFMGATAPRA